MIREEHAYQVNSILSDQAARSPMFGSDSVLNQQFLQKAVKTGTTNDFRDNWTVGYTLDIAVGVWVGNADYQPMVDTTGLSGAAPAWAAFIRRQFRWFLEAIHLNFHGQQEFSIAQSVQYPVRNPHNFVRA